MEPPPRAAVAEAASSSRSLLEKNQSRIPSIKSRTRGLNAVTTWK
jgi:hypothetical protein